MYAIVKIFKISLFPSVLSLMRVLKDYIMSLFIVNGDDHDTTIRIPVMSSKLIKSLSYYVARFILIFLAVYLVQ